MPQRQFLLSLSFLGLTALAGCMEAPGTAQLSTSGMVPPMQWDMRPEAKDWTGKTLTALAEQDDALAGAVPADIETWCPGYESATMTERRAFWAGMMSAVARYESSWNPQAAGGGGRYIGVMQISPRTADLHGCEADTSAELKDGAGNLACAAKIVASAVASDGVVAGSGRQGAGRDWMPMRDATKRAAMSAWTRSQPYCAI
ncbi:lytic transglycosylase [Gemmobacter aquarius]|uniref:Lytic transglycosylase n=1 Tax=Paragemmobacter aquarius TaxID=2169400 RepID=A0A2S0UKI9_9RHOB|nr:transglycosylase SLT domain-containing protein [Gemmobacter aquarius]AWB48337.1 lytic transglycosylase [Gemmobacter aquarius]